MSLAAVRNFFRGNREREARWRALKRLAVQGHDHAQAQHFFAEEVLARRWVTDRPWHGRYCFGMLYQILSDFGRSPLRPLAWLVTELFIFTGVYYGLHHDAETFFRRCGDWRTLGRGIRPVAAPKLGGRCQVWARGCRNSTPPSTACMTGRLVVPNAVSFLGVAQTVISATLIFLFLLTLRNCFRIR